MHHIEHIDASIVKNKWQEDGGLEGAEAGTYGEPVLLVGRSGGWGELGGVGGSELQTVALHSSILGHVGKQGLQSHMLLLTKVVPCHHAPNKVHLCRKWQTCFSSDHYNESSLIQPTVILWKGVR